MASTQSPTSRLPWLLVAVLAVVPGMICAVQIRYTFRVYHDTIHSWPSILAFAIPAWWPLLMGIPVARRLAEALPWRSGKRWQCALAHVLVTLSLGMVHVAMRCWWEPLMAPYSVLPSSYAERMQTVLLSTSMHVVVLTYGAIVAGTYGWYFLGISKDRELHATRLASKLAHARLASLESKLRPHFLFNTLNSISVLMETRPQEAQSMLWELSDLLRHTLSKKEGKPVPLKDELDCLRRYVGIERRRFGERVQFEWCVDPAVETIPVPFLLLQPLVENALIHGIGHRVEGGRVTVRAVSQQDTLEIEVEDDGVGLSSNWESRSERGIGLSHTRARLEQLYGERASLQVLPGQARGTLVRMHLPVTSSNPLLRTAGAETLPPPSRRRAHSSPESVTAFSTSRDR